MAPVLKSLAFDQLYSNSSELVEDDKSNDFTAVSAFVLKQDDPVVQAGLRAMARKDPDFSKAVEDESHEGKDLMAKALEADGFQDIESALVSQGVKETYSDDEEELVSEDDNDDSASEEDDDEVELGEDKEPRSAGDDAALASGGVNGQKPGGTKKQQLTGRVLRKAQRAVRRDLIAKSRQDGPLKEIKALEDTSAAIGNLAKIILPKLSRRSIDAIDATRVHETSLKTDTGSFSMATAISQGLLNYNLKYLHLFNPELQTVKFPPGAPGHGGINDEEEGIEADILAPRISLDVHDFGAGAALYYLSFGANGSCRLRDGSEYVTMSTKNWVFVFGVNIALKDIQSGSEEYDKVKKQFGKPGDYRISRLFADLTTADIINPELALSDFGEYSFNSSTMFSFKLLMLKWMQTAQEAGGNILGYSITTPDPASVNVLPPSFPPTDQIFQVYAYIPKGKDQPTDGLGPAGDNNMLLYLNMTQNLPFPEERVLPYSGNWCTPSIPASMCLSREIFFDDFLLPRLAVLNRATYLEAKSCKADVKAFKFYVGYNWGPRDLGDEFEKWRPRSAGDGWYWKRTSHKEARDGRPIHNLRTTLDVEVHNNVVIGPGWNKIKLDGFTQIKQGSYLKSLGISQNARAQITVEYKLELEVKSVLRGNLELDLPIPAEAFEVDVKTDKTFLQPASFVNGLAQKLGARMRNDERLRKTAAELQSSLESTATFVLPGGGTFLLKDPLFNAQGDLLVAAEYNGID